MNRMLRTLPLAALALGGASSSARAQSLWPDSLRGRGEIGFEWVRPTFKDGDDLFSGTRGIWILDGRVRVAPRLNVVAALPRLVATDAEDGATMGNPYFGVEFLTEDGRPEFSFGTRIDMVGNTGSNAAEVGVVGDFDRFEAASTHAVFLTATGYHEPFRSKDGAYARIRFGATLLHPTGQGVGAENDMYFNYGVRIGRDSPSLRLSAEFTGRWLLSSNGASFAEASVHQGAVMASFLRGPVRPYAGFRVPVDQNLKPTLDHALIFGVTMGVE